MEEVDISSPEKREREDDFESQSESPAKKLKLSDSSDDKLSYHAELKEAFVKRSAKLVKDTSGH